MLSGAGVASGFSRMVLTPLPVDRGQVFAHGPAQPDVECVADERVADRHFVEMRQGVEQREVAQVEVVTGIDAQAQRVREARRAA